MAIKKYINQAAYDAATKPTTESQVSLINDSREVMVDGVNVVTAEPSVGDVLFLDGNNKVFLKGGAWLVPANIPVGWTFVGYVFLRRGDKVGIVNKDYSSLKFCDVLQFEWTTTQATEPIMLDGSAHTKSITLRFGNNQSDTEFTFGYSATTLADVATQLTGRIENVLDGLSMTDEKALWWAWADTANNRIIIQRDTLTNPNQVNCSGVTLTTFGDMPTGSGMFRTNGRVAGTRGTINFTRAVAQWSTQGRTPTAPVVVGGEGGSTDPVNLTAFQSNAYCADVRAYYGTYEAYLRGEYEVAYPQKYGLFSLPDGATLAALYATEQAPTKGGATKYKYPAMAACAAVSYNADGLGAGCWHLIDILEACYLLNDDTVNALTPSMTKMGLDPVRMSSIHFLAGHVNDTGQSAYATGGFLSSHTVTYTGVITSVTYIKL